MKKIRKKGGKYGFQSRNQNIKYDAERIGTDIIAVLK